MTLEIFCWIFIPIAIIGALIGSYVIWNLLRKVEKAEDILVEYITYIDKFSRIIESSDVILRRIDKKGAFSSDDEVGFFFKNIQEIQQALNTFKVRTIKTTSNPTNGLDNTEK